MASELPSILARIHEAYDRKTWHGPNLRGSIRGVTPEQASWRPAPGRHCIWDLVIHAAYWKYTVRRRITGEKRGAFPVEGSNWFTCPDPLAAKDWKDAVALLAAQHKQLLGVVEALRSPTPRQLHMLNGIAFHDVYHAGQIQLLKRLSA